MIAGIFEYPGAVVAWLYSVTHSYAGAIALIAVLVMVVTTPLIVKSTEGMLKMQMLAPELKKLQQEYKSDRAAQQQAMMQLYQEHGVNPMASCWPMAIQAPVFFVMFQILHGLTFTPLDGNAVVARAVMTASGVSADTPIGFYPRFISHSSELYQSLLGHTEMNSWGLDLSKSAMEMLGLSISRGLLYIGLVVLYGVLSLVQQRMVAARAAVSPTMSPTQQKLMQYLPVGFAVFQLFFLLALVIYYIVQTIIRIGQQAYITRRYYGHEESLGRKAQAASEKAREISGDEGGLAGAFRSLGRRDDDVKAPAKSGPKSSAKSGSNSKSSAKSSAKSGSNSKSGSTNGQSSSNSAKKKPAAAGGRQTTAPKGRPTPRAAAGSRGRPQSSGKRRRRS